MNILQPLQPFQPQRSHFNLVLAPPNPLEILGANLKGWWAFWDRATLFTDSARTTLATADGDAIAGVSDKSGNNNHMQQTVAGNRPLLRLGVVNGRSGLEFDGTDDFINGGATFAWSAANAVTLMAIVQADAYAAGSDTICGFRSNSVPANTVATLARTSAGTFEFASYDGISANVNDTQAGTDTAVNIIIGTGSAVYRECIVNGTSSPTIAGIAPATGSQAFAIGSRATSAADVFDGKIIEVIAANINISAAQQAALIKWAQFIRGS